MDLFLRIDDGVLIAKSQNDDVKVRVEPIAGKNIDPKDAKEVTASLVSAMAESKIKILECILEDEVSKLSRCIITDLDNATESKDSKDSLLLQMVSSRLKEVNVKRIKIELSQSVHNLIAKKQKEKSEKNIQELLRIADKVLNVIDKPVSDSVISSFEFNVVFNTCDKDYANKVVKTEKYMEEVSKAVFKTFLQYEIRSFSFMTEKEKVSVSAYEMSQGDRMSANTLKVYNRLKDAFQKYKIVGLSAEAPQALIDQLAKNRYVGKNKLSRLVDYDSF